MHIIWLLVFGLIVGAIARLLMPGPQPLGIILTSLLGVAGSFVGGCIGNLIHGEPISEVHRSGWIGAVVGSLLLLFLYGKFKKPDAP
jgi:uncharacterized membrane protein YeaQ/YmgE (transglycosylase-associated protein family)